MEDNSASAEETSATSEELAAQAARMNEYIEKYTVSHENSVMAVQTEEGVSELLSAV